MGALAKSLLLFVLNWLDAQLVGAFAAYTLYRCSHLPLARRGMQLVLTIYVALMFMHAATGMSALGWHQPLAMVNYLSKVPYALLTLFS